MKRYRPKTRDIPIVACLVASALAHADGIDVSGVAGPALLLWAIAHPIGTIQALSKVPEIRRNTELFQIAFKQCEAEQKNIPPSFDIDSFVDEGARLTSDEIFEFLAKRKVKAIYIRPQPINGSELLRFGSGGREGGWTYARQDVRDPPNAAYIKLEILGKDAGHCLPDSWMPHGQRERYESAPLLPNTCLAGTFTDKPEARYVIRYRPTDVILDKQFGVWAILDLSTNREIASLTTIDTPANPSWGAVSCSAPYTALVWRIRPDVRLASGRVMDEVQVVASPSINEIGTQLEPPIAVRAEVSRFTAPTRGTHNFQKTFQRQYSNAGWEAAVAEASQVGFGNYGPGLIDWRAKTLTYLRVEGSTPLSSSLTVVANAQGYYVLQRNWQDMLPRRLIRYNQQGRFEWAVDIRTDGPECASFPWAIETLPTTIVLRNPACDKGTTGINWTIKKEDIPYFRRSESKSLTAEQTSRGTTR